MFVTGEFVIQVVHFDNYYRNYCKILNCYKYYFRKGNLTSN